MTDLFRSDLFDICLEQSMLPSQQASAAEYQDVEKQEIDITAILDKDGNIIQDELDDFIINHVCDFVVEYINSDVLVRCLVH